MIAQALHEIVQGFIHALAYAVMTVFLAWLYAPDEVLSCLA